MCCFFQRISWLKIRFSSRIIHATRQVCGFDRNERGLVDLFEGKPRSWKFSFDHDEQFVEDSFNRRYIPHIRQPTTYPFNQRGSTWLYCALAYTQSKKCFTHPKHQPVARHYFNLLHPPATWFHLLRHLSPPVGSCSCLRFFPVAQDFYRSTSCAVGSCFPALVLSAAGLACLGSQAGWPTWFRPCIFCVVVVSLAMSRL